MKIDQTETHASILEDVLEDLPSTEQNIIDAQRQERPPGHANIRSCARAGAQPASHRHLPPCHARVPTSPPTNMRRRFTAVATRPPFTSQCKYNKAVDRRRRHYHDTRYRTTKDISHQKRYVQKIRSFKDRYGTRRKQMQKVKGKR